MLQYVGPGRPAFDYAWRGADLLNLREICLEWLRHCDHLDAHLHGQRVCGNVVWPLGWSAGIFAQVRIDLLLHHRFGKCTERLSYANDVGSFWILHAVRRETRLRLLDFDLAELENVQHLNGCHRITLIGRNHESVRRAFPRNGAFLNSVKIAQPTLAV